MPTLKEIKGRIGSVKSTLKITSAMKLVSSAKLRKAQKATEAMRPYEQQLQRMLSAVGGANAVMPGSDASVMPGSDRASRAIIAIASNSSLCGGFNTNVINKVRAERKAGDVVYSIGRKMADAMRKEGFPSPEDYSRLAEHPEYAAAAALADKLMADVQAGVYSDVLLIYNHFVSTAKQVPTVDSLLKMDDAPVIPSEASVSPAPECDDIIEPSVSALREILLPKVLKLKLYATLLDSAAAEHAARTVAMQTATDNGENLLQELTLQYNKGRQQKITAEILDLAGGQSQD